VVVAMSLVVKYGESSDFSINPLSMVFVLLLFITANDGIFLLLGSPGYAVLVKKAGHFLEKVGLIWKKPYFFSVGQVLVV
jgi:hypothetical protein